MNTTRRWMSGLLLGLLSTGFAVSASAAGYLHCPHPDEPDRCYPIYAEEAQLPIGPDPGPYQAVDISSIVEDIKRALDVSGEPDPEPWLLFDMENRQVIVMDLSEETAYMPAPEPGQLAMLISGTAGLGLLARRRRR